MTPKALLIPIAAFAVTVTGVSAFNSDALKKSGLSSTQISAFEEAHELRMDGDKDGARNVLEGAGVNLETMKSVRTAMYENRQMMHDAVEEAIKDNDYDAFKTAIAGSPLADIITSENDFKLFVEAHDFRENGNPEDAHAIMDGLGFEGWMGHKQEGEMRHHQKDGDGEHLWMRGN